MYCITSCIRHVVDGTAYSRYICRKDVSSHHPPHAMRWRRGYILPSRPHPRTRDGDAEHPTPSTCGARRGQQVRETVGNAQKNQHALAPTQPGDPGRSGWEQEQRCKERIPILGAPVSTRWVGASAPSCCMHSMQCEEHTYRDISMVSNAPVRELAEHIRTRCENA